MKIQLEQLDLLRPWPTLRLHDGYRQMRLFVKLGALPIDQIMIRPIRTEIPVDKLRRRLARSCHWNIMKGLLGEGLRTQSTQLIGQNKSDIRELRDTSNWREYVQKEILNPAGISEPYRSWCKEQSGPTPSLTIVVCTCDRPASLEKCLDALRKLDYPDYQTLVVDNSVNPLATREIVDRFGVEYLRVAKRGKTRALNAAMNVARTRWLAFTDDDCVPRSDWLRELVRPTQDTRCRCVTGLVDPAQLESDAEIIFEIYGGLGRGFRPVVFDRSFMTRTKFRAPQTWTIGAGANMLIDRELVIELGGYDEDLGPGRPAGPCEDIDMYYRLMRRGWTIHYTPRAVVAHFHRCDAKSLRRQLYTYGRAHGSYHWKCFWRYRDYRSMLYLLREWPRVHAWRLKQSLKMRSPFPLTLLGDELRGMLGAPFVLTASKIKRFGGWLLGLAASNLLAVPPAGAPDGSAVKVEKRKDRAA